MKAADLHRRAPNTDLTPIIILRWLFAFCELMALMAAPALWEIDLPVAPILSLIGAAAILNLHTSIVYKGRQVPEETVRLHIVFDIIQFTGILYFTGGLANPYRLLYLCPLALAASLLSLFNLCLMIMLTILCVSISSFTFVPMEWFPFGLSPSSIQAQQLRWAPLILTVILVSFIIWRLAMNGRQINEALQETQAILASKQQNSALGALAAAAVHELGSPLSTIAVVAREMEREITPDDPLADDVALLKAESEKCKKILADIARDPAKTVLAQGPLRMDRLLMELASEHSASKIDVHVQSRTPENLPYVIKTPNLEYGLGNLIGNATSFSTRVVNIAAEATADRVHVRIRDDGPGFPPDVLRQIGKPYISLREGRGGHLGLGIFIAVNLLDATEAQVSFSNWDNGAQVDIHWERAALSLDDGLSED
jgi:two-component system sensor histidine kinase RegB